MSEYSEIRAQLEAKLRQLMARAEQIDDDLRETPNEDWEEQALDLENDEVLASMGNLALKEMEQIRYALHQIDAGSYGRCSRCGAAIPPERLEALPYATRCTKCA
jgi:RNA polymerase-binding transcription factor DksA